MTTARQTAANPRALSVESTDSDCNVSAAEAPAGTLTFDVTNTGSQVTEFYLLGEDGLRIVSEVENIGPNLNREMTVNAPAGAYFTACKPGMKGEGIRADFTVTESDDDAPTVSADEQELIDQAVANYAAYVQDQSDQLLAKTQQFVDLYKAGDDDAARTLYPDARVHWERIETVAESFGDLDPMMDAREADLEPGQKWTGWHLIEKDLWPAARRELHAADARGAGDVRRRPAHEHPDPRRAGPDARPTPSTRSPTARAACSRRSPLGKVTGEEEYWSHTDLWDFQANVDGARVGYEGVKPILEQKDPELADRARRPVRRPAGAARRAAGRRRVQDLRPSSRPTRSSSSPTRSTRCPSRCPSSPRRCCPDGACPDDVLSRRATSSAAARPPPGWRARSRSAGPARARATRRAGDPPRVVRRSAASTRPASSPRPRTGCTSRRSTSPPTTATGSSTLLQQWTEAAERMTARQARGHRSVRSRAPPTRPPDDTGEAIGLSPSGLTITFGFGPSLFRDRRRQGPVRPRRPAARGAAHAAALPGRRARPGALVRRPLHPGLRRRPAGRRARDPQPGPDRLRHGRGPLVAARLRPHLDAPRPASPRRGTCSGSRTAPTNIKAEETVGRRRARLGRRPTTTRRPTGWPAAPTSSPGGST